MDEIENAVQMQTELRLYGRTGLSWMQKVAYVSPFWSIACSFVLFYYMRPVLLGCNMTLLCYMTRSIIHYVHDHNFETLWLSRTKNLGETWARFRP